MTERDLLFPDWLSQYLDDLNAAELFDACVDTIRHRTYGIVAKESTLYQTYDMLRKRLTRTCGSPEKAFYMLEGAILEESACRWCEYMMHDENLAPFMPVVVEKIPSLDEKECNGTRKVPTYGSRKMNIS